MILHVSWTALFNSPTSVNGSGNRNIAGFTGAMDFEANLDIKMTRLNQPLGFLLVANFSKEVTIIHHPHNFNGTLLRPTNSVGCLVGTGPNATPLSSIINQLSNPSKRLSPLSRTSGPASRLTRLQPSPPPPPTGSSTSQASTASSRPFP